MVICVVVLFILYTHWLLYYLKHLIRQFLFFKLSRIQLVNSSLKSVYTPRLQEVVLLTFQSCFFCCSSYILVLMQTGTPLMIFAFFTKGDNFVISCLLSWMIFFLTGGGVIY